MDGWFKTHRKLLESQLWLCEPFTRGQAWIDLVGLANYEESYFYVRGVKVEVQRGQIAWSEPKLAERWSWSRTKLRKFLNDLEKEQQIIQQKNNVVQIVTIVNYNLYQEKEQQIIQQKDSRKTAERQQKDVYKNSKESKEGKEGKEIKNIIMPYDSENFAENWERYKQFRKKQHKFTYLDDKSEQIALNELKKISHGNVNAAIEIINRTINMGWKGLFELKHEDFVRIPNERGVLPCQVSQ